VRESLSGGLLEREDGLTAIEAVLDEVRAGAGRGLVIEGPAGIGKTALLAEAQRRADGFAVVSAAGGEFEADLPLGVARQLFEPVLWRATESQRERWLRGPAAIAGRLLGVAAHEVRDDPASIGDAAAVRSGLYWLAVALAEDAPLLVVVDDLHWTDPESLWWVVFAARRLEGTRIALIAATRPREPGGEEGLLAALAAEPTVALHRPEPLSARATGSLVGVWSGSRSATPEFEAACHEASGGNPFLLSELLGEASRAGVEPDAAGAGRVGTLVPEGLSRAVLLRLRPLGAGAIALAQAVAAMGASAELRHAAALADLTVAEATAAADALTRVMVLRDAQPLELAHPLLRAAVLSGVTAAMLGALHGRAARLLAADGAQSEVVAAHLVAAPPSGDAWAVDQLIGAAEQARSRGAPEAAARFLERALLEPPADFVRARVEAALGSALSTAGDPRGIDHVNAARALTADPVERAMLALRLGTPFFFLGRGQQVAEMMRAALDELGGRSPALAFGLRVGRAGATASGARFDPRELVAELLDEAAELDAREPFTRVGLAILASVACQVAAPAAVVAAIARRALGDLEAHRAAIAEGFPLLPALTALGLTEDTDRLEEHFALVEEGVRRRGALALGLAVLLCTRAKLALHCGALEAAADHARAAVALTAETRFPVLRAQSLVLLAGALRTQGELEQATAALGARPPDEHAGIWAAGARGELAALALARGDHLAALRESLAAGEIADRIGAVNPSVSARWRSTASLAMRAGGDCDGATRLAAEEVEHARAFGAPGTVGAALRIEALVLAEPDLLAEAERSLAGSIARLEHAETLVDLGAALRRRGDRTKAREPLAAGMEIAHRCGATPLVERARTELRAAGARPRSIVRTGVDALTPSERRIAELAAAGRSNREIAQELFVTKSTVETHLRSIFRKLDLTARGELARHLT
jgi:DNA-binding CsgD family transcriptional regulator